MRFLKIVWMVTGILLIISSCTDSYVGRWIFWNVSDIEDYEKFPNHKLDRSVTPFSFFPSSDDRQEVSFAAGQILETDFNEALEKSGTTAFLIIRNDTLLYENYFNDYSRASVNTSFSMAKSITSLLVGIALDKALIGSESDPVTKYIPELSLTDAKYSEVTINHLLNMKSGIRFADHDAPWGDKPKAYYYPDLRDKVKSLEIEYSPGENLNTIAITPLYWG
ncbi:MAG: serine hydrolase [Flammeovirgaceae bacterium]|nr:serine hydrolase [Flammeovirgaceae bacterium]